MDIWDSSRASVAIFFVAPSARSSAPSWPGAPLLQHGKFLNGQHVLGGILVWFFPASVRTFLVFPVYGLIYARRSLARSRIRSRFTMFPSHRDFERSAWEPSDGSAASRSASGWPRPTPAAPPRAATKYQLPAGFPAETILATAQNAGRADAFRFPPSSAS
jgi:hypothetical protein